MSLACTRGSAESAKVRLSQFTTDTNSMSRKGNCWDNAAMESFFGSLKEECVGNQIYSSQEQARQALFEYLEIYYNCQRRHSALGYVSLFVYEQKGKQDVENNV